MEKNCREWELTTVAPKESSTWRSGVRYAKLQLASYLPARETIGVDDAPALHVNKKRL